MKKLTFQIIAIVLGLSFSQVFASGVVATQSYLAPGFYWSTVMTHNGLRFDALATPQRRQIASKIIITQHRFCSIQIIAHGDYGINEDATCDSYTITEL